MTTVTRDLAGLVAAQLLWTTGQGKGVRCYVQHAGVDARGLSLRVSG